MFLSPVTKFGETMTGSLTICCLFSKGVIRFLVPATRFEGDDDWIASEILLAVVTFYNVFGSRHELCGGR